MSSSEERVCTNSCLCGSAIKLSLEQYHRVIYNKRLDNTGSTGRVVLTENQLTLTVYKAAANKYTDSASNTGRTSRPVVCSCVCTGTGDDSDVAVSVNVHHASVEDVAAKAGRVNQVRGVGARVGHPVYTLNGTKPVWCGSCSHNKLLKLSFTKSNRGFSLIEKRHPRIVFTH